MSALKLKVSQGVSKDRVLIFFTPDFSKIDEAGFGVKEAAKLKEAVKLGIKGVKIFKTLGLEVKDKTGNLVPVDDPHIDPIRTKCGELGIPVVIHASGPKAFFTPIEKYNERFDVLGANIGILPEELGRQPYTARKFLIKNQDRILLGTDTPRGVEAYFTCDRFLETDDEYFDTSGGHHLQGVVDDLLPLSS